jgi:hypothetical protein
MESNIRAYLEDLESELMFGKCAGKNAYISKLYQNKVENKNQRVLNFERLRRCLEYHLLGPESQPNIPKLKKSLMTKLMSGDTLEPEELAQLQQYSDTTAELPVPQTRKSVKPYFDDIKEDKELIEKILHIFDSNNFDNHFVNADKSGLIFEEADIATKEQSLTWKNLVRACDDIYTEINKIEDIWQFIDSKSAVFSGKNAEIPLDFSQKHLGFGFVDRIPSILSTLKTLIFGGPGYGKTIFLQQIASDITSQELREHTDDCLIPIFVKAKYVSEGIINTLTTPWGRSSINFKQVHDEDELSELKNNDLLMHHGLMLNPENSLNEIAQVLTYAISKTLPNLDTEIVKGLFRDCFKENFNAGKEFLSRVILFVDAYDECPKYTDGNNLRDNRLDLDSLFFDDLLGTYVYNVTITCRNSHRKELRLSLVNNGSSTWDSPWSQILEMKFTEDDLRFEMPIKLANAWGLNSTNLDWEVQKNFDKYKEVLTHPLFVGLFCLMINEEGYDLGEALDKIPDCKYDEYGPHHVKFIQSVINYGLEISIKSRFPEITEESLQKIRKAFLYFAAGSLINDWNDISTLWNLIEGNQINLTKEEKEIMKNELGVVYLSDGNEITWTHRTVSEVATGMLLFEESKNEFNSGDELKDCLDFLSHTFPRVAHLGDPSKRYVIDKSDNFVWSECMILTLGLLCSENSKESDYRLTLMKSINHLEYYNWAEMTLQIIFFYQEVYSISDDWKIDTGVPWEILFANETVEYQLAEMYINYVDSKIFESPQRLSQRKMMEIKDLRGYGFTRIPSHCFTEYSRDYNRTAFAVEVFNKIELYVERYPVIETTNEYFKSWPSLRLTEDNFDDYTPSTVSSLEPFGNISATWKLINRHFKQTLLCQQSGIEPDSQAEILLRRLREWTGDGGDSSYNRVFHFEVPGAATGYGFISNFMRVIIGIYRNYGRNDELLEYISRRYAKNIFDEEDHKQIVFHFRQWLDEIAQKGHLSAMFTPREIEYIKEARIINNDDLLIIVIYSIYCNPNITMKDSFDGSEYLIQYIRNNEDKHRGVYFRH